MKNTNYLLITSIVIAHTTTVGTIAASATTSGTTIVKNSEPYQCNLIKSGKVQDRCHSFKLSRVNKAKIEKAKIKLLMVEFSFKDARITYGVVKKDAVKPINRNGKKFNIYAINSVILERRGFKPKFTSIPLLNKGGCAIESNHNEVACNYLGSTYLYTGRSNNSRKQVKSSTRSKPSRANKAEYTFTTKSYINTGLKVNRGDKIQIQANGSINFGLFAGSGGPKGIIFSPDYNYFADVLHGQLIGRIKRPHMKQFDGWFRIGKSRSLNIKNSGVLELAVNDNKPRDNRGGFRIRVTIHSSN